MFDDFLNHTCNIYHVVSEAVDVGYGIRTQSEKQAGSVVALEGVPCHFHVKANSALRIMQSEPFTELDGDIKLTLPSGTDIRENDTVESCETGLKYRAGLPRTIHGNHHMIVPLYREGGVKAAI